MHNDASPWFQNPVWFLFTTVLYSQKCEKLLPHDGIISYNVISFDAETLQASNNDNGWSTSAMASDTAFVWHQTGAQLTLVVMMRENYSYDHG